MIPLHRLIKALLWFVARPSRWRHVTSARWRNVAASCHWSARLHFVDLPEIDAEVCIGRRTSIQCCGGRLVLSEASWIGDDCEISVHDEIRIGQGTSIQHRSQLHGDVEFGVGCVCAANLYVASSSHRFRDAPHLPIRWQDGEAHTIPAHKRSRKVVIEDDCWLGINVVICPGVIVGRGTVVGANSVVTASLPPYSVVGGVPARVIGSRLDFQPPGSVCASNPEDNPYFYAGFTLPQVGQSWVHGTAQGRWAGPRFALALRLRPGGALNLMVVATRSLRLLHGSQVCFVEPGESSITLQPVPDDRGLLWFVVEDWRARCLAVSSAAEVCGTASAEGSLVC